MEDDDGPGSEVLGHLVQIGEDDCRLFGCASPGQPPDQDHLWRASTVPSEQAAEIGVSRDQDALVSPGVL